VWKLGGIRKSMQMQRNIRHSAECENCEELERVCRCKGDVRHTVECENGRNKEEYADAKVMSDILLSVENGWN
jgi:hypothetical protein